MTQDILPKVTKLTHQIATIINVEASVKAALTDLVALSAATSFFAIAI